MVMSIFDIQPIYYDGENIHEMTKRTNKNMVK